MWQGELVQPDKTDLMPPDRLTRPLTDVLPHVPSVLSLGGSFLLARRTLKMLTFSSCPFVGVLSSETQDACRSCWWLPATPRNQDGVPSCKSLRPANGGVTPEAARTHCPWRSPHPPTGEQRLCTRSHSHMH